MASFGGRCSHYHDEDDDDEIYEDYEDDDDFDGFIWRWVISQIED